jgi:ABC-type cobalamin/Fe3+-siderophores transport system ATPase subunit
MSAADAPPALEARHLAYRHHGAAAPLFSGLDLRIASGSFAAIIGPNGSGKTTLLRLLAGLIPPEGGAVFLDGEPLAAIPPRRRALRLALVMQEAPLMFDFGVLEIVLMGRAPRLGLWGLERADDFAAARRALEEVDLAGCADRSVQELSSGERQRVFLARALAQEPSILLLDEPTAFLDLRHALALYGILERLNRTRGLTVVVVSHDLTLAARHASRLVALERGRIAADGTPLEIVTPELLRAVYATEATVVHDATTGSPVVIPIRPA